MDDVRRGDAGLIDREADAEDENRVEARDRERGRRPDGSSHQQERQKAEEDGRGRHAETPSEIPAKGWKDILLRVYRSIGDDRILANAAAVTFFALLALFPGIAALVSIYGLFSDPASIQQQLDAVSGVLPGGAIDVIRDQLNSLAAQPRGPLRVSFVIGL